MLLFMLSQEVSFAGQHMQIARGIAKVASDKPHTLECAQIFFALSFRAHLESAYARAARLFDPKSGTATIPSILQLAEQKAGKFQFAKPAEVRKKISTWRKRIEGVQPTLKRLHDLRNRLMSHLDRGVILDPDEMTRTVAVKFDEVEKILQVANDILTSALDSYINAIYTHELPSAPDCEALFRILEKSDAPKA